MSTAHIASRLMTSALLALGIAAAAQAASLSVTPVNVMLDGKKHSAALTLRNEGSESRVIQTELLRWTQENGENVHTPSRDILVNPPIVTLRPGQTQIIRIGLNRKADKAQELAYRLYVSEVPPPPKEGFTGLRIALRLGIPVFVSPAAKTVSRLEWKATRSPEGALQLTMLNNGNRHIRLNTLKVSDPLNGQHLAELNQPQHTLLAGQTRRISLPLPSGWQGRQITVHAKDEDDGMAAVQVELEQPAP